MEEMDIKWNMALLSMRADKFWKRTGKKISIQGSDVGSKAEEQAPKALMVIDRVGWDWSYMANDGEDHALVADKEAPTEVALMANTSTESKVFDNSLCSKDCKKNNDSLNTKITDLTDKFFDAKNLIHHYKLALAQVESRLVEYKEREVKYCEKIRTLEFYNKSNKECIEILKKKLKTLKQEKDGVDGKLAGLLTASKDRDNLIESQRADKNKEGLGYSDDTVTDYSRPEPTVESSPDDAKKINLSVSETVSSPITPKPFVKFVKASDNQSKSKTDETETPKKSLVKYAKQYRKTNKKPNVRGNKRNWNNLKSDQLGPDFVMKKKACFNCGDFNHLAYDYKNRNFPTANRKFPTASRKFPTGSTKFSTADMGMKGKAGSSQNKIDDKGYWDSGCSRHMTGNISYLSDYEPFDGGYVSFGQGRCKITRKGTIKSGKLEFENVYFVKDLKDFKLLDDTNMLLRTPRRLGHLNFKTMNKLVRHNLVRGLPTKCFENDHNCTACLKRKHHKASYKSKLVNSMSKPLHTLHMGLFGPTSVSSISHKWYCLVVTDDFSRFTWTFFLKSKDETIGILKKFISKIKNLKDLRVKIIRCDNRGEFQNKEMNDFCSQKGIKREFSNARTPQQNGVAERKNKTLIEAARTTLADAKLPVTFWAEAVNTACYVQNRVLVNKSHNKTPYELFNGRTPAIGFLKPFRCHVMILNTLNNLGKFEGKGDEGYFIGYSMSSKAFRVFNKRTKRVEENLHIEFLENKAIEKGAGPNWLFDIDSLTKSMNYVLVVDAGTNSTNFSGIKDAAGQEVKKDVSTLRYIDLPNWAYDAFLESSSSKSQDDYNTDVPESSGNTNPTTTSTNPPADQVETLTVEYPIPTASQVTTNSEESNAVEADVSNMETTITASPTPTLRIHRDHPKSQIIGLVDTPIQTKNKFKEVGEQGFIATIHQKTDPALLQFCLFSCFLSQVEPKKISDALQDPSWVEAMFSKIKKDERGIVIRNKAKLVAQWHTQEERINYDEVFAPIPRIEAIRLFLAYASFMGFTVYQMDLKSAFLYGTINEEVYVMQPPRFQDPEYPSRVYKVEKAMYRLHQAPRAWYGKDGTGKDVDLHLYRSMIGSLMYLTASRPDIMFAVCACAKHQDQTIVATSTTEAEYVAAASCCGQVLWIQNLWCKLFSLLGKLSTVSVFLGFGLTITEAQPSSHTHVSSLTLPTVTTIPTVTPSETTLLRQYTQRVMIAQSSALLPVADEPASPMRDVSQGEACPTDSGFVADQDRENIAKTSTLPHDLQRQQSELVSKFATQALEITELKARVKFLEDRQGEGINLSGDDAPIKGKRLDTEEVATERVSSDTDEIRLYEGDVAAKRVSDDTEEMATVLITMDAASVLSSRGVQVVPTAAAVAPANVSISTGSGVVPTASTTIS
nr:hypothetical protein [Tanacetum cinerariifolium]